MFGFLGRRQRWPYQVAGGRVALRPLRACEVPALREWLRDPDLVRSAFGLKTSEEALEQVAEDYCREIRSGRRNVLAIDSADRQLLGFVRYSLRPGPQGLMARVGILLGARGNRGRGLGTEAMRLLLGYLFEVRRVVVVELDTADFNRAAQRSFEKAGFRRRRDLGPDPAGQAASTGSVANKVWMEFPRDRWDGPAS